MGGGSGGRFVMSFRNLKASRCRCLLLSNINNKEGKEGWKENQKGKKVSYFSKTLRTFGFFFSYPEVGKNKFKIFKDIYLPKPLL